MPGSLTGSNTEGTPRSAPLATLGSGSFGVDSVVGTIEEDVTKWEYKQLKEQVMRRFEDKYLNALLGMTGGNVTKAAELAGVHRVNLHRMIKRRDSGPDAESDA